MKKETVIKVLKGTAIAGFGASMLFIGGCTQTNPNPIDTRATCSPGIYADTVAECNALNALKTTAVESTPVEITYQNNCTSAESVPVVISDSWSDDADINSALDIDITAVDKVVKEGKYDQNGNDVDFEQMYNIKGMIKTSSEDKDFEDNIYLTVNRGDIVKSYIMDDIKFDGTSLEDPIETDFGAITSIEDGKMTISTGEKYVMTSLSGAISSQETGCKKVIVKNIGQNAVAVNVDGITETVSLGATETVNGVDITVDAIIFRTTIETSSADLIIGTSNSRTYVTGDKISDSDTETWKFKTISADEVAGTATIEITNTEKYMSNDADEDYKAIGVGDSLVLPDGLKLSLELSTPDYIDLTVDADTTYNYEISSSIDKGLISGLNEWNDVYTNSTHFFDNEDVVIGTNLDIGRSDWALSSDMKLSDGTTTYDLMNLSYSSEDIIMMKSGLMVDDSESWNADKDSIVISVPVKSVKAKLVIKQ